jgi:hypothetical protein
MYDYFIFSFCLCKNNELILHPIGEMAERSNAAVLKTVDCNRSGGSNPSLSAKAIQKKPLKGAFFMTQGQARACTKAWTWVVKNPNSLFGLFGLI